LGDWTAGLGLGAPVVPFSSGVEAMDDMQFSLSKLRAFQSYQESVLVNFDNHVWSFEELVGLLGA
jgi:hypothetical protein